MSILKNFPGFFVSMLFAFSVGADPIKDNFHENYRSAWYTNVYEKKLLALKPIKDTFS